MAERPQNDLMGEGGLNRPSPSTGLKPEEQRVIDLALAAVTTANRTNTEEILIRTRATVTTEIRDAFAVHDRVTMGRRVAIALGIAASFGLGLLVRGWVTGNDYEDEEEPNGVHE